MEVNELQNETAPTVSISAPSVTRVPWFQQFRLLLKLLITDYRSAAPFLLLIGLALPLGFMWILSKYIGVGEEAMWLLAGNVVMAISFGSVSFAIQRTALMKVEGELDYYGSLSVSKGAFIAAIFVESIVFALPALISSLLIGSWLLKIPMENVVYAFPIAHSGSGKFDHGRLHAGKLCQNHGSFRHFILSSLSGGDVSQPGASAFRGTAVSS